MSNASSLVCSHSSVNKVIFPPIMVCSTPPIVPNTVEFTISNINFNIDITNPENGLYLFGNQILNIQKTIIIGDITVKAKLTPYGETPANVEHVYFLVDGMMKETVETEPFEWKWDETSFGTHKLEVRAYVGEDSIFRNIDVITFIF